jgi:hypothetical protein
MRLFFGMILGVVLTIGTAFISDTWNSGPTATAETAPATVTQRNMVNWDVVGENFRVVRQHAHEAWTALAHKVTS